MAGFMAGFGEQISSDMEARKKTLDRLIEDNLDNARIAKKEYANTKTAADQVLNSAEAIRAKYGLEEGQTLALVEAYGTELPKLQNVLDKNSSQLVSNLGVRYNAEDVMSYVNTAETLNLPEGVSLSEGVNRLMGLNYQELSKEKDPKSEGSKARSFIRAALTLDPQLDAAEKMESMTGPNGLTYAQLLEMQESGFAKEDVFGNVTRAGGVSYDYTGTTAKQTRNDYSRRLSTKIFDADLTDPLTYSSYQALGDTDKAELKANAAGAGNAFSKLERSIVLSFRGTDLSMNALRKGLLDDIYDRVDEPEELRSLTNSVGSGFALSVIEAKDGKLTDEDIDSIITGVVVESSTEVPKTGVAPLDELTATDTAQTGTVSLIDTLNNQGEDLEAVVTPESTVKSGSIIDNIIANDENDDDAETNSFLDNATTLGSSRKNAQTNIDNKARMQEAMADVSREEWDNMTRAERREAGLPVRKLDIAFAGKSNFKQEEVVSTPSETEPVIKDVPDLIMNKGVEIRELVDSEGLSSESSVAEIKAALTGWYNENQDGPIGDFVAKADMGDLKQIEDVVKAFLAEATD